VGESPPVDSPIFVCGMGRSGTTWISRALGESPELTYIREAWLIAKLRELDTWFTMLHDDWTGFTPWKRQGVDRRVFVDCLASCYRELLDRAADGDRFVEKTPDWNALHLVFLQELFPDAYYVLLHRDGRNCVSSLEMKNTRQRKPFDFETACRRWAAGMDVFSDVRARGRGQRIMFIRYEDLLQDFDAIFQELCTFVEIEPFHPAPRPPNSSFVDADGPGSFNRRWQSWSPEMRLTFKRNAGRQLVEWQYVSSNEAW
jgi:hypothetical protein